MRMRVQRGMRVGLLRCLEQVETGGFQTRRRTVQVRSLLIGDEELRSVRVWAAVRHGEDPASRVLREVMWGRRQSGEEGLAVTRAATHDSLLWTSLSGHAPSACLGSRPRSPYPPIC